MTEQLMSKTAYLGVAAIFISIIGALALRQIATANTSGWNSTTITLFIVALPVVGVTTFVLAFMPQIKGRLGRGEME